MISSAEYIQESLALHLFFARIMKEHSFFLEIGFTPKDHVLSSQADYFRRAFDALLEDVIDLSAGVVSPGVLLSGEVVTPYTMDAEKSSAYFTGVNIATGLTGDELRLESDGAQINPSLEERVFSVNDEAIRLLNGLIQLKTSLLANVLACRLFTVNYPLLIDHILREARLYLHLLRRLQNRESFDPEKEAYEQETFWNRIMAEHSKFIRGLLDPTEEDLFVLADNFGKEFDALSNEVKTAMDKTMPLKKVTDESIAATERIRDFNRTGTEGLLGCRIKSVIIPLLGDHVLRESNHYLRLLNEYKRQL